MVLKCSRNILIENSFYHTRSDLGDDLRVFLYNLLSLLFKGILDISFLISAYSNLRAFKKYQIASVFDVKTITFIWFLGVIKSF